MTTLSQLTESDIRRHSSAQSFERGRGYYEDGALLSITRRGGRISAEVQGSAYEPYRMWATLDETGLSAAGCSCPYDMGGYCKHIVAALLTCIHAPEQVEERPEPETLIDGLDHDGLRTLILRLIARQPDLADVVEDEAQLLAPVPAVATEGRAAAPPDRPRPDADLVRRQVRASLRGLGRSAPRYDYWGDEDYGDADWIGKLDPQLAQARALVEAGDGQSALVMLDAVTDECLDAYAALEDYLPGHYGDSFGELLGDLGQLLAEALLSADLTPDERQEWAGQLADWQEEYDAASGLAVAQAAAEQGWDYPPLVRVLQGEITEAGAWGGESPWYADDLAVARLNVLARQGRAQEYLYLAEAEGQTTLYVTMLAQAGRTDEALDYGLQHFAQTQEAFTLAQALSAKNEPQAAFRIAEHGLTLEGNKLALARWLRDQAAGLAEARDAKRALRAAEIAFRESRALEDYLAAQKASGPDWPQIKPRLLEHLTSATYAPQKVDIYLHENMVAEAIQAVDQKGFYYDYGALERVVDAAGASHPDWAIRRCRQQAEAIMDEGQAKYYERAVGWLRKARAIHLAAGRQAEWQAYLAGLLDRHARKYKLVPMLKALS